MDNEYNEWVNAVKLNNGVNDNKVITIYRATLHNGYDACSYKHKDKSKELTYKYKYKYNIDGLELEVCKYIIDHSDLWGATINERTLKIWFHTNIDIQRIYSEKKHPKTGDKCNSWQWHRFIKYKQWSYVGSLGFFNSE